MKKIEKLPTSWQPNKDVIVIKVNEIIDAINELKQAVKPEEDEFDYYECQRKTINILRKDVAKARLEGQIKKLEELLVVCRTDGYDIFEAGHYENQNYKDGYIRANQHFYKLFNEEIARLREELKK
jgi:hypothetical protein